MFALPLPGFVRSLFPPLDRATLCYVLAYLVGLAAFAGMARRRGLATGGMRTLVGVGLIGGLAGANLLQWLLGATPGKTVLGGIAIGYVCVVLAKRRLGIVRPTGDLFAVALMAGEAVGRWGCWFGGCCYGIACAPTLPWAVWQHGAYRHPAQLYLSLACFAILATLLLLERRRTLPENGLFYAQGALYCGARFAVEFFRAHDRGGQTVPGGLSVAQWACLAGIAYFGARLVRLRVEIATPARVGKGVLAP